MSTRRRISAPAITINNVTVAIHPGSGTYVEGLGETTVEPQSAGSGSTPFSVYGEDVTSQVGEVKFEIANTAGNIALVREWKLNLNANVVHVTDNDFSRTFNNAVVVNNYEVPLGADTNISVEFKSDPAI